MKEREHPRFAVEIDAEIDTNNGAIHGRTRDISRGGFCILSPGPLPIGSVGHVQLALVFEAGNLSEQLPLRCEIIWCSRLGAVHQIGARFVDNSEEALSYLDLFIRFLEADDDDDRDDDNDAPASANPGGEPHA